MVRATTEVFTIAWKESIFVMAGSVSVASE
jgi:hypothetical protein